MAPGAIDPPRKMNFKGREHQVSTDLHGKVYWSELMTRDVEGAMKFYRDTCGWAFEGGFGGTYQTAFIDGCPVAGIMDMNQLEGLDGVPAHWFTYLAVDDISAVVQKCRKAGATILREAFNVPTIGEIAIMADPTGAVFGFIEPAQRDEDRSSDAK